MGLGTCCARLTLGLLVCCVGDVMWCGEVWCGGALRCGVGVVWTGHSNGIHD